MKDRFSSSWAFLAVNCAENPHFTIYASILQVLYQTVFFYENQNAWLTSSSQPKRPFLISMLKSGIIIFIFLGGNATRLRFEPTFITVNQFMQNS